MTGPALPPGRTIRLPGGHVVLRECGPPTARAVILLHGWTATADINFFRCYRPLSERYRVLAFDHRGHGTGIRSRRPFRLTDCADDVMAVADALGIESLIPIGYSMGGPVAQLVWRRHRRRVTGLVLCSTATQFSRGSRERAGFVWLTGLAAAARLTPAPARQWLSDRLFLDRKRSDWAEWAFGEVANNDWRMVLEAGAAIGRFRSDEWIATLDVPASVLITELDEIVPVARQRHLSSLLPDVDMFTIDAGHEAAVARRDYPALLLQAVDSVVKRGHQ